MGWKTEFIPSASKDLKKLDKQVQKQIINYLKELVSMPDPFAVAKKLANSEFHRFRCGDYRIVCHITEEELIILVILVSHRKSVYSELNRRTK